MYKWAQCKHWQHLRTYILISVLYIYKYFQEYTLDVGHHLSSKKPNEILPWRILLFYNCVFNTDIFIYNIKNKLVSIQVHCAYIKKPLPVSINLIIAITRF